MYILILIFAFGSSPSRVQLDGAPFANKAACLAAGTAWVAPISNPMGTINGFECVMQESHPAESAPPT